MSNENSAFYFEPVRYVVRFSRRRFPSPVSRIERRQIYMRHFRDDIGLDSPAGRLGERYFFQKTVAQNKEEFEVVNVQAQLMKLISNGTRNLLKKLKEKFGSVLPYTEVVDTILPQDIPEHFYLSDIARLLPRTVYFHKTRPVAIFSMSPVSMYILGNKRKDVEKTIKDIKSKCEILNEITVDFGLELVKVLTSHEYQRFLLNDMEDIEKTEYGKPKNDFEQEVLQTCEETTTSLLSNLTIIFSKPKESFEYDLFIGFGEGSRVIIEPTDYESLKTEIQDGKVGKDTLKSRVILGTLDKARRLKAESVVVVKGFPEKTFIDLKSLADSRGVSLMSDQDYKENLPFIFLNNLMGTLRPR